VTITGRYTVRPAEPTPSGVMYLNASDQIKDISHTPTIYFYRKGDGDAISRLRESLAKALVLFYPLAGRLAWAPQGGSRVELLCNAEGVAVLEAETEDTIDGMEDFTPTTAIEAFIPAMDYTAPIETIPLVAAQLTRFGCGGVSLGLGICHVMADGPSALHFVDVWAKVARGDGTIEPPFLDRKVLDLPATTKFDPSVLRPPPTLIGLEDNQEQKKKPITVALLNLTKLQIQKLREKANLDLPLPRDSGGRGYTRFEALTCLHFVADFRNKLQPPLPHNYFGNALIRVESQDKSGQLLSSSVGTAAKKIRESVEKVRDETVRAYLEFLKGLPDVGRFRSLDTRGIPKGDFYGNPNLVIISWTALALYGADFGWGKEIHMGPGSMGFDGKTFLIPSQSGDGSLNVVIWLQEEHMPAFKKLLYDEI
ncbi:hypothetical protein M569_09840, partial [Genlisea aurea]